MFNNVELVDKLQYVYVIKQKFKCWEIFAKTLVNGHNIMLNEERQKYTGI